MTKAQENELREILKLWRTSLLAVGKLCVRLIGEGVPESILQGICCGEFGMTNASFAVCIKWARDEFPDIVVNRVPHTVVAKMTVDVAKELATKRHRIIASEGRVATKSIAEMTPEEITRCVTPLGVAPIKEQMTREPEIRTCVAGSVTSDGPYLVFISRGRDRIRMKVSARLLEEALESMKAACTA